MKQKTRELLRYITLLCLLGIGIWQIQGSLIWQRTAERCHHCIYHYHDQAKENSGSPKTGDQPG